MKNNKMADLKKLVPPPKRPLTLDKSILDRNERVLMIEFPADFVEFGETFGSGTFRCPASWDVWSPYLSEYPSFVMHFSRIWSDFKDAVEAIDLPFEIFPEVGGLLPFATSPDGDWVCWVTHGPPDDWTVVDVGLYEKDGHELFRVFCLRVEPKNYSGSPARRGNMESRNRSGVRSASAFRLIYKRVECQAGWLRHKALHRPGCLTASRNR